VKNEYNCEVIKLTEAFKADAEDWMVVLRGLPKGAVSLRECPRSVIDASREADSMNWRSQTGTQIHYLERQCVQRHCKRALEDSIGSEISFSDNCI